MEPKKLQSIHNLTVFILLLLLIFSGGFLWGEFKKVSNIASENNSAPLTADIAAPKYITGETRVGKELFVSKCQRCHLVDRKMTGPALMNVKDRWNDSTKLYAWIRNSPTYLTSGDKYADNLFREYNNSVMPAFPELKEEEIAEILYYVDPS